MTSVRGLLVHVALLFVSLGLAYQVWSRSPEEKRNATKTKETTVVVWDARAEDVQWVDLMSDKKYAKVERRKGDKDGDAYFWVTTEREKVDAKKPGDTPESLAAPAEPASQKKAFLGGDAADKVIAGVAPLRALRALGKPGDAQTKDFGLAEAKDTLRMMSGGRTRELALGAKVYGGSDRYALDRSTGEVFVLGGDVVRDLESAESRLMEREVHAFKADEVGSVQITRGQQKRELKRGGGADAKSAFWADAAKADTKDETATNWMTKVDRLKVQEYVEDETKLGSGDESATPEFVAKIVYVKKNGGELGHLEISRLAGSKEGKFDYYVRSEHTRRLAKVSQYLGEQVEQDLDAVVTK